jgi:hypothetical protein
LTPGWGSAGQSFFFVNRCWWLRHSNAAFKLAEHCMWVSDSVRHWHEPLEQHSEAFIAVVAAAAQGFPSNS